MSTHNPFIDQLTPDDAVRVGEEQRTWFRSERIYSSNGGWWFACRDGLDQGPYPDREEAEAALVEFLRAIATANSPFTVR